MEDQTFLRPELKQNNHQFHETLWFPGQAFFFPYLLVSEQILFPKPSSFDMLFPPGVHLQSDSLVKDFRSVKKAS